MFCEECGKQLADDAAFCPSCGKAVNNNIVDNNGIVNNNLVNNSAYNNNSYNNIPYNNPNNNPYNNAYQLPGYSQPPVYQQPYVQQPYVQQPHIPVQPTIVNIQPQPVQKAKSLNGFCVAGFALSIAGMFIGALICGLAATTFSIIGIVTYDENKQDGKWMGLTGVVLGIIDLIIGLFIASFVAAIFEEIGML